MLFFAGPALAQTFVPLTGEEVSKVKLAPFMTDAFSANADLSTFVNAMFKAAIGIGAMLAVLQIARGGFYYMGSDMWHKKEQAKHLIQDAVTGLLILMAVWLVLNQINPQLLNLNVLEGIKPVGSGYDSVGTPVNGNPGFGGSR